MRFHAFSFLCGSVVVGLFSGCSQSGGPQTSELRDRLNRIEVGRRAAAPSEAKAGPRVASGNVLIAPGDESDPAAGREALRLSDVGSEAGDQGTTLPAEATPSEDKAALYAHRGVLPGFGQTVKRDVKTMAPDLWRDTKRVYANPVNLAILGVSYGGALAVQETGPNRSVEDHYSEHHTFSKDWRDAFGAMGNPGTHFAVAGVMYLIGQQAQDDKTYEVSKALFSALIINGVSTMVGQAATSDRAPNGEWGTFPSGHTSSTFCFATVMNEAYGPFVGVPLYGLGTLVAIERLDDHEHYFADVLYGGVLGIVVGHSVASGRDPEFFGWKILPYVDPQGGGSGVAFMKTWK